MVLVVYTQDSHGFVPRQGDPVRKLLWGANPWNNAPKSESATTASSNGSKTSSAPVAIATFVVIVVLVIIGFAVVLWFARRRRLRMEGKEEEMRWNGNGRHVVVILPDNKLACAEVQMDEEEA